MTATRWWVQLVARWLARIGGVQGHLRLAFLAMTGNGIVLQTLSQYGYGDYAIEFLVITTLGMVVYTYYYTEGGVWNQVGRDRQDLSTNYSGPTMAMDDTTIGVAAFVAINGRKPTADERKMIEDAVMEQWHEYRDGIPEEYLNDSE